MEPTPQRLKIATNYHEANFPKAAVNPVQAHSWHEVLFYGWSESEPAITKLEGQPEKFRAANGKTYIPDALLRSDRESCYFEIKSKAELETARLRIEPILSTFAAARNATYRFVTHEEIDAYAAHCWFYLKVTRWVMQYREQSLAEVTESVLRTMKQVGECSIELLLHHHAGVATGEVVGVVCILLHKGTLTCCNVQGGLSLGTLVALSGFIGSRSGGIPPFGNMP